MRKSVICLIGACFLLFAASFESHALFLKVAEPSQGGIEAQKVLPKSIHPVRTFKLTFANAKSLAESLASILGEGEGASANEALNAIIVRASKESLDRISEIINKVDKPPLQVQVEAKIIELKAAEGDTTTPSSMALNMKYSKSSNDYVQQMTETATTIASSLGLYAQLLSGNVEAYFNALQKTTGYDLVASPWITTINHGEAEILIGSKYGYKTTLTTTTGTMQNISFLEVGTKLKFTPHISEDGFIVMDIAPSVSEGSVKNDLPQEDTTQTKNKVLVRDGQSIVVGGLIKTVNRQIETGVPILASIPLLGTLFRKTELTKEKREIMVVITPHIVTPEFLKSMNSKFSELNQRREDWSDKARLIH